MTAPLSWERRGRGVGRKGDMRCTGIWMGLYFRPTVPGFFFTPSSKREKHTEGISLDFYYLKRFYEFTVLYYYELNGFKSLEKTTTLKYSFN